MQVKLANEQDCIEIPYTGEESYLMILVLVLVPFNDSSILTELKESLLEQEQMHIFSKYIYIYF